MRLRVSSWAIRRPLLPFVLFICLLLAGWMMYLRLPINDMPNVHIPTVNITVIFPGAAPREIESQITQRVEAAVSGIGHIRHMTSTMADSVSNTQIEFQIGTNIESALARIRDQMVAIRPLLPRDAEDPQIQRVEADSTPTLTFSVDAPGQSIEATTWFVDSQVTRALLAIKGVARVERQGGLEREVRIALDPVRLQAYGITPEMVNEQLRQTALSLPAGRMQDMHLEMPIRIQAAPRDLDALAALSIALPDGRFAHLQDFGTVQDTTATPRQLARRDHQPVVAFAIYHTQAASEVGVEREVNAALARLKSANPGVGFTQIQSLVDFARESYRATVSSFLEGALLAALVVFLFLRDVRATWIAGVVIPLSVIPTFIVMHWLGFSLNLVSLLALSLVSGILVDDAIVEIENILRHVRMGKTPYQAALEAADEIGLAVVATTLVIVAVFLPVSFMQGVIGQYFIQFGVTVSVATLFSLLVARLITPVLAAYFLKPIAHERAHSAWLPAYLRLIEKALCHRRAMLLAGLGIVLASIAIAAWLPTDFLPAEDKSLSTLQVELPPGARLADTDLAVATLTDALLHRPEVKSVYALTGGIDGDTNIGGDVQHAILTIQLVPGNRRKLDVDTFEQRVYPQLAGLTGARIGFLNEHGDKALNFTLTGDNPEALQRAARSVEKGMLGLPQLTDVSASTPLPRTEIIVTPRADQAARLGVSAAALANTIRIATLGDLNSNLARISLDNRQIPLRVILDTQGRSDPDAIGRLPVPTHDGKVVPLASVARVSLGAGPSSIERYDRQRQITLAANLNSATLGAALAAIDALPAIKALPAGVARHATGDSELLGEMFDSFVMAMMVGILAVFAVLVLLYRTLLQPLTIMMALPLSIGGALLALWASHASLSLPAVIGILMLMGIVGKNGILLVDCIIECRRSGMPRQVAILAACRQRAQPIVMTTLSMIAGMLPVLLGLAAGTAFRTPMAIALIGGLLASTALSLLFIPVIYTVIDDIETALLPRLRRLTSLEQTSV